MRAILFDVFGTLVDWRSSLIGQFHAGQGSAEFALQRLELLD
ncbi:haloacid dehalogenase type II, partial [Pseudomonas aeruginosa]|nr:haloacid dehalogenase type II [Pseudomonas aeruginosa]